YWHRAATRWVFATAEGCALPRHTDTAIQRHVKVQGRRSPYDGDWVYWGSRLGRLPTLPRRTARLLRRQQGRCAWCGLPFHDGAVLEIDHIIPTARGGRDSYANWHLLHGHCHDAKTAADPRPSEVRMTGAIPLRSRMR